MHREHIENLVKEGIVTDIFRAEQAYYLLKASGEKADRINLRNNGNFGSVFSAFQTALNTEAIMAIARVFDNPSKKYPTRCLKGLLNYLVEHSDSLPSIKEPYQLKCLLKTRDVPEIMFIAIDSEQFSFPKLFSDFVLNELDTPQRIDTSEKLRFLRDKVLAHNEKITSSNNPSWLALNDLISLAQFVVGVLGWAYFSMGYFIEDRYLLSDDAQRPSRGLNRLIKQLYEKNDEYSSEQE